MLQSIQCLFNLKILFFFFFMFLCLDKMFTETKKKIGKAVHRGRISCSEQAVFKSHSTPAAHWT